MTRLTAERLKEIRKALEKSTKVVAWYPHQKEVRGPYCRWFILQEGDDQVFSVPS